jgi:hypothetical protein
VHILFAIGTAPQKARRFMIQLLADFLADAAPFFGLLFYRLRLNHFFHHRKVFRPSRFVGSVRYL